MCNINLEELKNPKKVIYSSTIINVSKKNLILVVENLLLLFV